MRIRVSDQLLLPDLLRFLRDFGCIAYYAAGTEVEAIRPRAFGEQEAREIEELLERWQANHPNVTVTATGSELDGR